MSAPRIPPATGDTPSPPPGLPTPDAGADSAPAARPRWWRLAWASACAGCGCWPSLPWGDALCATCETVLVPPAARCPRCAHLLPRHGPAVCADCLDPGSALDAAAATVTYAPPWRDWLLRFKTRQEIGWATLFARLMAQSPATATLARQADCWMPIPMSPRALSQRGYNQAWLLTQALHRAIGRPAAPCLPEGLLKTTDTPAQHTLSRRERLHNLRAAYAVSPEAAAQVRSRRVLLIDDIMTTGATLSAAAAVLKRAGASHVAAVVFARSASEPQKAQDLPSCGKNPRPLTPSYAPLPLEATHCVSRRLGPP